MQTNPKKERLWNYGFTMVVLISTLSAFSFYTNQTILSKYLTNTIGVEIGLAGTIVGLFSLTSLFTRPFCGIMADRLNKKMLLLVSNLLMAVGLLGFAYVKSVPLFIFMRIINGLGFAIGSTVQVAMCTNFMPKSRISEGMGYMGLGMVLGSAVAPGLGIALANIWGMKSVFLVSALMPVIACFMLLALKDNSKRPVKNEKIHIHFHDIIELKAWVYSLCGGIFSFTNGIINAYIVLFADAKGLGDIGLYFTVYAICLFVIRPLAGKMTDRLGMKVTVLPGMIIAAVSLILLSRSTALWMVLLSAALRAVGQGSAQPSLQAGCITYIGTDRSGVATSTYYLCGDIGQGFGPIVGGWILAALVGVQGYQTLFLLCSGLMIGAMILFAVFAHKKHIK